MPHDRDGCPLAQGDTVTVQATITSITGGENDCNVTLQVVDRTGTQTYLPTISCNSKLVDKIDPTDATPVVPETTSHDGCGA